MYYYARSTTRTHSSHRGWGCIGPSLSLLPCWPCMAINHKQPLPKLCRTQSLTQNTYMYMVLYTVCLDIILRFSFYIFRFSFYICAIYIFRFIGWLHSGNIYHNSTLTCNYHITNISHHSTQERKIVCTLYYFIPSLTNITKALWWQISKIHAFVSTL